MSRSRWPARRPSLASSPRRRRGDRAAPPAGTAGPRAYRRGLRPHRPHHRAAGLGARPHRRRAAWRLGALGRHHAEHHPDRRSAGAAPGARASSCARSARSLAAMADLAERGADMPIAGRTHGQHAVPATFGYKVAVWIDELLRHVERLAAGGAAAVRRHAGRRRRHLSPRSASRGRRCRPGIGRHAGLRLDDRAVARASATTWRRTSACSACWPRPAARSAARSTR